MDHLEGAGIGVVDAPLLGCQGMFEQLDLDPVIAERTGLVEPERLQIAGHHLHRRDPAGLHGGDEIGALLERGLAACISAAPEPKASRIGKTGHGSCPGGGDIEDTGIGQGVLQTQSGASLLRGGRIASRPLGPGGVGHGVGLVEDDDAAIGMAGVFIHPVREPAHDLFEAGALSLAGGRAQGCIGGEQDPGLLRNIGPLAELAQRDEVGLAAADRGPVAAGVLEQLVGGGEPQGPAAAAQPVVEDDGGDLAALAAAGAVAQHPAAPETHRRRQHLAIAGGIGGGFGSGAHFLVVIAVIAVVIVIVRDTRDGLPALADAIERGKMAAMGLTGEDDTFELGVGEQFARYDTCGQHRAVGRYGMGHRRHGGGLHQRRRMFAGAGNARGPGPPGLVDAGMGGLRFGCLTFRVGG